MFDTIFHFIIGPFDHFLLLLTTSYSHNFLGYWWSYWALYIFIAVSHHQAWQISRGPIEKLNNSCLSYDLSALMSHFESVLYLFCALQAIYLVILFLVERWEKMHNCLSVVVNHLLNFHLLEVLIVVVGQLLNYFNNISYTWMEWVQVPSHTMASHGIISIIKLWRFSKWNGY